MFDSFAYWHWLILGLSLTVLELLVGTFIILWFGIGALIVGICLYIMPELSLNMQLIIWLAMTAMCAGGWFTWIKPKMRDRTQAGIAREAVIGQTGTIININEATRGTIRFTTPVLGADEWQVRANEPLQLGERAKITEINGNTLYVTQK